jgi:iron-sulfur cluster protein
MSEMQDAQELRHRIRSIKEHSIGELESLVKEFTANAERRGAQVYFASDAAAAIRYVLDLGRKNAVKLVVKSKSLTTEEIELNQPLEALGIRVLETDLGEWIIQAAGEKPYHLVFPAVHKTSSEVAELLGKKAGLAIRPEPEHITRAIRGYLRPFFLQADIGITGANVAIAETGTIVVETNEGNARLVSSIPKIHLVIVGIEKIARTWDETLQLVQAHPVSATGQRLTNYVSFISGRLPLSGKTDRELHIVLLDNGRLRMKEDPWFKDALYCIRCGACMNICPTYGVVGGHVFGHIYPGPIGIPWTAEVHGIEKAGDFAPLCIACGLCKEICPAEIEIPLMISKVKELDARDSGQLLVNAALSEVERFARVASSTAPISNWVIRRRLIRYFLEKIVGIDRRRSLPEFKRDTFTKWFSRRTPPKVAGDQRVVYFVDLYANYNDPELAKAALAVMEGAGIRVEVPPQKSIGMPYMSYGELEKATEFARYNVSKLHLFATSGYSVVTTEPTAAYMLRQVYPKLLKTAEANEIAAKTFELFDYLERFTDTNYLSLRDPTMKRKRAGFHISCHQRALSGGRPTLGLLQRLDMDVRVFETGTCCGMAGTFGLKKGPLGYDLAMEVGRPLFELFTDNKMELVITESSVCAMQLGHGTPLSPVHPIKLLTPKTS